MARTWGYGEELSGSINAGNFLTSGKVYWLASQEGLCSMEYIHYSPVCISLWNTSIETCSVVSLVQECLLFVTQKNFK